VTTDETDAATADPVASGIAAAVRAQRLAAGLSMRALATRAGMSQPFLSNLENSRAMPSIATLYKIAAALGVSPRDFLPAEGGSLISVVRAGDGTVAPVGDEDGTAMSRFVAGGPGRTIEAHMFDVAAGAGLGDWFEHEGEDLLVVLAGAVHVEFGDGQHVDLAAGDVLWHVSTIAHRWTSQGAARLLLVNAHPTSTGHGTR
jgi:transcriptional regulator with XRE-family HTH domain/mannose-6-phosphate isomerase-like protein (cupin superfamily)